MWMMKKALFFFRVTASEMLYTESTRITLRMKIARQKKKIVEWNDDDDYVRARLFNAMNETIMNLWIGLNDHLYL